eukprot:CCRYP_007871-RA/>CCRYP_007871-RA protein AED:0.00 eAED:0.00 QI:100/1/1/1/0/0/2/20/45
MLLYILSMKICAPSVWIRNEKRSSDLFEDREGVRLLRRMQESTCT